MTTTAKRHTFPKGNKAAQKDQRGKREGMGTLRAVPEDYQAWLKMAHDQGISLTDLVNQTMNAALQQQQPATED